MRVYTLWVRLYIHGGNQPPRPEGPAMTEPYVYTPRTDAQNAEYIANIARLWVRDEGLSKRVALLVSATKFKDMAEAGRISDAEDILRVSTAILDGLAELPGLGNVRDFALSTMGE